MSGTRNLNLNRNDLEDGKEHLLLIPNQIDGRQDYRNARNVTAMSFGES